MSSNKPNLIYKLLYLIITFIYFVYSKLSKFRSRLGKQLNLNDLIKLRDSKVFNKKNDHIALVVNYEDNEPLVDDDLVKLISWSLIFKIPYVSVYDHDGILIDKRESICDKVICYLESNVDIVGKFRINQGEHERSFNVKGDDNYNAKLRFVNVLDGKEKLVNSVKELLEERLTSDNNNASVSDGEFQLKNPNVLTNKLKEEFKFPDPDLCIICSSVYNVYGYPPWEIRYTEFVIFPDLQDVNIKNFKECLAIFNKKEQRKGK